MAIPADLDPDPTVRTLQVLSSRASFLVMRDVYYGTRRFDDFQRRLGLSPSSLAARLRALVADGLLAKVAYQDQGQRTRHEYALTEKGHALLPALVGLMQWGNEYLTPEPERRRLEHAGCGATARAEVRCEQGHEVPLEELRVGRRVGHRSAQAPR
jgi:DNA-binding HxlR family transcriptional regulator